MVSLSSFFILILFGLFRQIFNNIFKKIRKLNRNHDECNQGIFLFVQR